MCDRTERVGGMLRGFKVKNLSIALVAAVGVMGSLPTQAAVIYNYVGQNYTVVDSWLETNHDILSRTNAFSFTFGTALGGNLAGQSVAALVTDWSAQVYNTPRTHIGSDVANSSIDQFKVWTDASGHITNWAIGLTGYTDNIYHDGILGKEFFSSSLGTEAVTFYNPPGRTSWLSGYRNGAYGLAYCMGFSCDDAVRGTWSETVTAPANPGNPGGTVPEPSSLALAGLAVCGWVARRSRRSSGPAMPH